MRFPLSGDSDSSGPPKPKPRKRSDLNTTDKDLSGTCIHEPLALYPHAIPPGFYLYFKLTLIISASLPFPDFLACTDLDLKLFD